MVASGIPPTMAMLMSILVFAGASMVASAQLLASSAPIVLVVVTTLVINLRFMMYSASLRLHFADAPLGRRLAVAYLTARVDGRVDRVFADFPGTVVAPGDHLVSIYSPDLLTTQREFLLNLQLERQRAPGARDVAPTEATRQRLLLWGVTEAQIVPTRLDLTICYAPAGDDPPRARVARSDADGSVP